MPLVEISRENNPLYPLPADYPELSKPGKRLARINATRQWLIPTEDKTLMGLNLAASLNFFDLYYLWPDEEKDWNPGFYDIPPVATPRFHFDILRLWAPSRLNVTIAPRGSAKTTLNRKDMLLRLVTEPRYSFFYATSTNDNAELTGNILRMQCYENDRLNDDFGPEKEFGGRIKPSHGSRAAGTKFFYLTNGSSCRCVSTESRLRGGRPRRFRLDDPEYDARESTSESQLRANLETQLFNMIMPMLTRPDTGIDWLATFVSKRHYAYAAMQTMDDGKGGVTAVDKRFNYWNRLIIDAVSEAEDGRLISCWPQMWPADEEDRKRHNVPESHVTLEQIKEEVGPGVFLAEYRARPGELEDQYFNIDLEPKGRHAWWIEEVDDHFSTNPHQSETKICYRRAISPDEVVPGETHDGSTIERRSLKEFLSKAYIFQTVDTAFSESATSDRRVSTVMAVDEHNHLFVLDMWSDRKNDATLVEKSFELAAKWGTKIIFVETVRESIKLYRRFQQVIRARIVKNDSLPSIKDYKPGNDAKTDRISTLDLRVDNDLLKIPMFRKGRNPGIQRLLTQICEFNPQVRDGGLEKDDEIDTVAMSNFVFPGGIHRHARKIQKAQESKERYDLIEELRKGTTSTHGVENIAVGVDMTKLPLDVVLDRMEVNTKKKRNGKKHVSKV